MSDKKSSIIMISSDRLDALEHCVGDWLLANYCTVYSLDALIRKAIEESNESLLETTLLNHAMFPRMIRENPDLSVDYMLELMRAALKEKYEYELAQKSDSHDQLKN